MEYEVGDLLRYDGWKSKESRDSCYCIVTSKSEFSHNYYEICWLENGTKSFIYSTTQNFEVVSK